MLRLGLILIGIGTCFAAVQVPAATVDPNLQCGEHEEIAMCGIKCEAKCVQPSSCATNCENPACGCIAGYVRHPNGACVLRENCPSQPSSDSVPPCGVNEKMWPCGVRCEPKCGPKGACATNCEAPACGCIANHERHPDGRCVPKHQCPSEGRSHCERNPCPVGQRCIPEPKYCFRAPCPQFRCVNDCPRRNEVMTQCSAHCEPKCGDPKFKPCTMQCSPTKCACKPNHARNSFGVCVPRAVCNAGPDKACDGNPCPDGHVCKLKPKECKKQPCPQFTCEPIRLPCPVVRCMSACKIRNDSNGCPSICQCPGGSGISPPSCGVNEKVWPCGVRCEPKCGPKGLCGSTCERPACGCIDNYERHPNGRCVPKDQCPSESGVCPRNEVMTQCNAHCESKCGEPRIKACTMQCSPTKCACKPNHARNSFGVCVPFDVCDATPDKACDGNPCPTRHICKLQPKQCESAPCPQFSCEPVPCPVVRCSVGCKIMNDSNGCPSICACPSGNGNSAPSCGVNEKMWPCGVRCEPKCGPKGACATNCEAPACGCIANHERHPDGRCVPKHQCPLSRGGKSHCESNPCPVGQRCIAEPKHCFRAPCPQFRCINDCPRNEVMTQCNAHCESKCGEPRMKACTMQCSPTKCACKPNHARNSFGVCVPFDVCDAAPDKACNGNPCPAGHVCKLQPKQCESAPCPQFTCEPIRLPCPVVRCSVGCKIMNDSNGCPSICACPGSAPDIVCPPNYICNFGCTTKLDSKGCPSICDCPAGNDPKPIITLSVMPECGRTSSDNGTSCSDGQELSKPVNRFYWDEKTHTCRAFKWYGCGAASNSYDDIHICYKQCSRSDPPPCSYADSKAPTNGYQNACNITTCPDGYKCQKTWTGVTVCCNAEMEQKMTALWQDWCPNNTISLAHGTGFGARTVFGDTCETMMCPDRYECQQINNMGSKCCEVQQRPSCFDPKSEGNCTGRLITGHVQRWYWDMTENKCMGFMFTGCGGNGNNFASIEDCLKECKNLRPDRAPCAGDMKSLLKPTPGTLPPFEAGAPIRLELPIESCDHKDAKCPDGYFCKRDIFGNALEPLCCEETAEAWQKQVFSAVCPNEMPAYRMKRANGEHYPLVGVTCDDIKCPDGFFCSQINKKFARCCATSDTEVVNMTKSGVKQSDAPSSGMDCTSEVDVGTECGNAKQNSRWYYNTEKKECLNFWYNGCNGNSNRFLTRNECTKRCVMRDRSPCRTEDVPPPIMSGPAVFLSPNSTDKPQPLPPMLPHDCFRPGSKCPDGYKCTHGMNAGVCCNKTSSQLYDEAYNTTCANGVQAYSLWTGDYIDAFFGDNCETLKCPIGFTCQQVNSMFAKCCGIAPPASPADNDEFFETHCQTPCAEGCYPLFTKVGCPRCHCPATLIPVVLEPHQKSACTAIPQCPGHCPVSQNFTTKCLICGCDEDDREAVHPVRFQIGNGATVCLDLKPSSTYTLFSSEYFGVLKASVSLIPRGNRVFTSLNLQQDLPSNSNDTECPSNEVLTTCNAHCELKCGEQPSKICTRQCSPTKCACKSAHARNLHGACVPTDSCSASNESCAGNPCPDGQVCQPEPKQCVTTPCPQFRCESVKYELRRKLLPGCPCRDYEEDIVLTDLRETNSWTWAESGAIGSMVKLARNATISSSDPNSVELELSDGSKIATKLRKRFDIYTGEDYQCFSIPSRT